MSPAERPLVALVALRTPATSVRSVRSLESVTASASVAMRASAASVVSLAPIALLALLLTACGATTHDPEIPSAARGPNAGRFGGDPLARSITEAQRILRRRIASGVPGMSAAVALRGKVVWSEGFGYANVASQTPVTSTSEFRIGSVAKPITSIALGQLVERGALDLDAPVQTYAPSFPRKDYPISSRQLAGHLSCIRHYKDNESFIRKHYDTLTSALEIFQNDPLLCEPGTAYHYSSYGWNLLGVVIEGASGETYLGYMRTHVFDPLGMTHTVPDLADRPNPDRTEFYTRNDSHQVKVAPPVDNSYKWPSGGLLSTPEDLLKFGTALLAPGFLKPSTLALLFTPLHTRDGEPTHYGLGWMVGTQLGHRRLSHSGGSVGGTTWFAIYPDDGLVIAVIANLSEVGDMGGDQVGEAFLDAGAL